MSDRHNDDLPDGLPEDLPDLRDHLAGAAPYPFRDGAEALAAVVAMGEREVIEVPAGSELRWAYCPNGWAPLMRSVVAVLDEETPGWTLRDSKADLRQLDVYVNLPTDATAEAVTAVRSAIHAARDASALMCEWCGAQADGVTIRGWHSTLCVEHAEKIRTRAADQVPLVELRARDE